MEMKNAGIKLPAISLTIQLMYKSNLEEASKENIMTKVNMDEHQTILSETVKAMREMKSMTSAGTKTNETLFSDYQRQGYAGRKSDDRFRSRNGRSRNREGRSRTRDDRNRDGRSRNRDDRSRDRRSRNREYIRSRDRSGYRSRYRSSERNRSKGRSDGYGGGYSRHRSSRGSNGSSGRNDRYGGEENDRYRRDEKRHGSARRSSRDSGEDDKVNNVHYSSYSNFNCEDSEFTDNDVISDGDNSDVIKEIYKEGNDKADPYHCIVDTGCPKTVAGQPWK